MSGDSIDEAPDLSQSYTEIKEDLEQQEQQQQPEEDAHQGLEEPRPEDIQELDTQKDSDPPSKTQPKRKPRQRKDVTCDDCGKTYSSKTKSHKCVPPTGFVKISITRD